MKISKIKIKNLYGISEIELDDKSVELTGITGSGKTSVIDSIRYALTNDSSRDYIVKKGENEGEIIVETDDGLVIDRKKRTDKSDFKSIRQDGKEISSPESFLRQIFTPLQLNPVEFVEMSPQEQNRVILDLIDFKWDLKFIEDKFGEIPKGVDYDQNILKVLSDIAARNGYYYQAREDVNRDIRNQTEFVRKISLDIPAKYDAKKWEEYDLGKKYQELNQIKSNNDLIDRASNFVKEYDEKVKAVEDKINLALVEKNNILDKQIKENELKIAELRNEILLYNTQKQNNTIAAESEKKNEIANLKDGIDKANEILKKEKVNTESLEEEIKNAEEMKKHLNEYNRMITMQEDLEKLREKSAELDGKINLARTLPGEILQEAKLPVDYLTIEDGIPLIKGLPISNLSDGEKLDLCIDITIQKSNALKLVLIDGAEKLSTEHRKRLYQKCKDKGLQFIASRTDDSSELTITEL